MDDPETTAAMQFMIVLQRDPELARKLCVFLESQRQIVVANWAPPHFTDDDVVFLKQLHIAGNR